MLYGGDDATETAKFVDLFDKFFDSLNVKNDAKHKRIRTHIVLAMIFGSRFFNKKLLIFIIIIVAVL